MAISPSSGRMFTPHFDTMLIAEPEVPEVPVVLPEVPEVPSVCAKTTALTAKANMIDVIFFIMYCFKL
jgi:hypothetical protein